MSPEQQDTNPYASPQTPPEPETPTGSKQLRWRWRLIPTQLLAVVGAVMIFASGLGWVSMFHNPAPGVLRPKPGIVSLVNAGLAGLSGAIWLYSASAWWRGR